MRAVALAATLALIPACALPQDRMVTLPDHRKMHLVCQGGGKLTAIFEAGFGADGSEWNGIMPKLAPGLRVCAYHRAGAGRSDPGPLPRDGDAIAKDLEATLRAANITGPPIGVGHSSGGLYMRVFAARNPGRMAGLVLVDPSIEHAGGWEQIRAHALACQQYVEKTPIDRKDWHWDSCIPKDPARQAFFLRPQPWKTQVSEIETLFTTTSDQVDAGALKARDIPTIILSADQGGMAQAHAQMARRFSHVEQRTVPSGHMMMFDRPEAIVAAVKEMATGATRRPRR
jgi:pimeloyl-ACP methyl ester carboxylesterase